MKVVFEYNKEQDVWCLLNYGKSSTNSSSPTKVYEKLVSELGENLTEENTSLFIEKYVTDNNMGVLERTISYQKDWDTISDEYRERAEKIFGVTLPKDVTAYLSINTRSPYSIENNYFFISLFANSSRKTAMHELWHFYTWYKYGIIWEEKIGKEKYNDIKEALTVLLNVECKDLLPEGVTDNGYPQHKELRERILKLWSEEKKMDRLWEKLVC